MLYDHKDDDQFLLCSPSTRIITYAFSKKSTRQAGVLEAVGSSYFSTTKEGTLFPSLLSPHVSRRRVGLESGAAR